jgi:hypothetical protein
MDLSKISREQKETSMEFLNWLQALGKDANPSAPGFQAGPMYVFVCVALPVVFGLLVGFGLRLIERIFGVELGKGGGH